MALRCFVSQVHTVCVCGTAMAIEQYSGFQLGASPAVGLQHAGTEWIESTSNSAEGEPIVDPALC